MTTKTWTDEYSQLVEADHVDYALYRALSELEGLGDVPQFTLDQRHMLLEIDRAVKRLRRL